MDYKKFNSKLSAAKQIYGRVRRMERRAYESYKGKFEKQFDYSNGNNAFRYTFAFKDAIETLDAAKREELDALRNAAKELAYNALRYIFEHTKEFQLFKPRNEWLVIDRLALIDGEIYEFDSAKYELKFDFNADKRVLVSKEFNEPISNTLLSMWSLKRENVEYLLKIAKIVKNQLK